MADQLKIVDGIVLDPRVKIELCPRLDHGPLDIVHAIVMHQTYSSNAKSTLAKYNDLKSNDHTGAHFLLDKDGTMRQTLRVTRRCAHVAPIKSRCIAEHRCSPEDLKAYADITKQAGKGYGRKHDLAVGNYESKKSYPDRWPFNPDAIGIEVVGMYFEKTKLYENVTAQQNAYLHWFVADLLSTLHLTSTDVYRHPMLQEKTASEAASVTW